MTAASLVLAATHAPALPAHTVGTRGVLDALTAVNVAVVAMVEATFPGAGHGVRLDAGVVHLAAIAAHLDLLDTAERRRADGLDLRLHDDPPDAADLWAIADEARSLVRQLHRLTEHRRKRWPGTHWYNESVATLRRLDGLVSP